MLEAKPNPIDRLISYFSPVHGARRAKARLFEAFAGSYNGASRSRRATKSWQTQSADADSDTIYDLPTLRERSRDLVRNAPIATGAIGTALANVVGTGLKLQSRIDADYLGMSEEEADAWEDNVEREWRLFSETIECDLARTLKFVDLQALAFRQVLENGDVLALLPRKKRQGSPYSLKIQLVEADRICNKDRAPDKDGLIAGVQKDIETGAPTAYHVLNQHPESPYVNKKEFSWQVIPAYGTKTGLRNALHLFEMLRPGQTRGIPFLSPVIETLKQLDRYTEAEIMAAVVSGMFTVFMHTEDAGIDFDLSSAGIADETGATSSDSDIKLGNGAVVGLKPNEKIECANPGRPNSAFDPFVKAILEQIGAALGIPFEVLIRHFSSSYSASRAALLEAWRFFRSRRVWLAGALCQPIYEIFLYECIAMGRISAPGFFADPMIAKAYSGAEWTGDSPLYIDPQKDVDSAKARIDARLSTHDAETTLLTGGNFDRNVRQLAKEQRKLTKAGISLPEPAPAKQLTPEEKAARQKEEDQE